MALDFTNIPDRQGPAAYVLGDGSSLQEKELQDYVARLNESTRNESQAIYLDSTRDDGLKVKEFYQIQQFPCVIIVNDDDTLGTTWYGLMPQPDEVRYELGSFSRG